MYLLVNALLFQAFMFFSLNGLSVDSLKHKQTGKFNFLSEGCHYRNSITLKSETTEVQITTVIAD